MVRKTIKFTFGTYKPRRLFKHLKDTKVCVCEVRKELAQLLSISLLLWKVFSSYVHKNKFVVKTGLYIEIVPGVCVCGGGGGGADAFWQSTRGAKPCIHE